MSATKPDDAGGSTAIGAIGGLVTDTGLNRETEVNTAVFGSTKAPN